MIETIESNDFEYAPGTLLAAKEIPLVQLRVVRYLKRIYYCERVGHESAKMLAYFYRELAPFQKA